MSLQARVIAFMWCSRAENSRGEQRLQARKPAASAAEKLEKNTTFSRFGGREAQVGRQ
jgi:hypothetical protein